MKKQFGWCVYFMSIVAAMTMTATETRAAVYTLTVDGAGSSGPWNRFYEECVDACHTITVLHSSYGRNIQPALRRAHAECGFKKMRSHGIFTDGKVYSETNGTPVYNWVTVDSIYDSVAALGMTVVVEFDGMPPTLASGSQTACWYNGNPMNVTPPKDYTKWQNLITAMVQHMEQRYGAEEIRKNWSFEVWNEPDQAYFWSGTQADYLKLYDYAAEGVRQADSLCRVGGPATSGGSPLWIDAFTSHVVSGTSSATGKQGVKCDFVTYHRYSDDPAYANIPTNPSYPGGMNLYHRALDSLLQKNNFKGDIQCTEWAPCAFTKVYHSDDESSGSFIAKTIHLLSDNDPAKYPLPTAYSFFCLSDIIEEWNAGTTTGFYNAWGLLLRGDKNIPDSRDVAKPSYNAFRLLHKLTDTRISLTGGTTDNGVNGVATLSADSSSMQVLLYNHVDGATANSASSDSVVLTVNNIPFAPGPVKVEYWVVDHTHCNAHTAWQGMASPPIPTSAQWTQLKAAGELAYAEPETTITLTGKTFTKNFHCNVYSAELISLSSPTAAVSYEPSKRVAVRPTVFMGQTSINVYLPDARSKVLRIFNLQGKLVFAVNDTQQGHFRIDRGRLTRGSYVLADDNGVLPMTSPLMIVR